MYTDKDKEIRDRFCELEELATLELSESRKARTKEEREEHMINALIAETSATYIVRHYRGIA